MNLYFRNLIILGAFSLVALFGVLVSYSAPYISSSDELVYLTGTLQAKTGSLPDAHMLKGMNFRPYLYPEIMSVWYERLGHYAFKTIHLTILIFFTGLSAYTMFRLLWLPWVPALLMSVSLIMPRFSSGMEIFGVLTFKEAIGRAEALPLFLIATGLLIRRAVEKKSLWPVFAAIGFFIFLHPVTVMLFAAVSLFSAGVLMVLQKLDVFRIIREIVLSGTAFVLTGSYFFAEVFTRLSHGISSAGVSASKYAEAIVFRNAWEFPAESVKWFPHMAIVSVLFLFLAGLFYLIPAMRGLKEKYPLRSGGEIFIWGLAMAVSALVFTIVVPGINLYLMEKTGAPYIFQQWSRISKFYYLGVFVALVPAVYALWFWFKESKSRLRVPALIVFFVAGALSSSFAFEVAQYAVGYKNFEKAYIPRSLSKAGDSITAEEYRETCGKLSSLGASVGSSVVSNDFGLRYYCKADLFVTFEEGGAYQQLSRKDLVEWYENYLSQRDALKDPNISRIADFAKSVGGEFVVLSRTSKYGAILEKQDVRVSTTNRHIILKIR